MTFVAVHWIDAHSDRSGGWILPDARTDDEPYRVVSVGHHVRDKPGHITLCLNLGEDDSAEDSHIHIPIGMVERVDELGVVE